MLWKVAVFALALPVLGVASVARCQNAPAPGAAASGAPIAAAPVTTAPAPGTAAPGAVGSTTALTKEQFEALAPNGMIVVNGQTMTKQQFLAQVASGTAEMSKKLQEAQAQAKAAFASRRKAFLDDRQSKLDAANKQAMASAASLLAQATAGRPANFDDSVTQANALLRRAETASPSEAAYIENQSRTLLQTLDPDALKTLSK